MKLIFLTQNDPFYLPKIFDYLIPKLINEGHEIDACVVFDVAPFGKKESKFKQLYDTYKVFGLKFTFYYLKKYFFNLFQSNLEQVLFKYEIKILRLNKSINHYSSINEIKNMRPDLMISLAGNEIFKKPLFKAARYGVINLHSALLPKYRGLMPSFWVLLNNEHKTGVSVFFVDEGIDSGPIIVQKEIIIGNSTQSDLIWKLKYMGADSIIEACSIIQKHGKATPVIINDDSKMTYYSRPTKIDVQNFISKGKHFF